MLGIGPGPGPEKFYPVPCLTPLVYRPVRASLVSVENPELRLLEVLIWGPASCPYPSVRNLNGAYQCRGNAQKCLKNEASLAISWQTSQHCTGRRAAFGGP